MPKVTAITGYYNRSELLPITLDSLLAQDYDDFRVVVFDDASTDDTKAAFEKYVSARKVANIELVSNERNLGFTRTLMNVIDSTDSEYIAIVGSGDYCHPERLSTQAKVLDDNPNIVLVGSHFRTVLPDGRLLHKRPDHDAIDLHGLLRENGISHGEVMFRRSTYEKVGGYRPGFRFSPDYDLWLRFIREGEFFTVKKFLYDRHVQLDGASYSPKKFALQARYAILCKDFARRNDQGPLYQALVSEGPEALVPNTDQQFQKKMVRGALRNLMFGDVSGARAIARDEIVSPLTRHVVLALCSLDEFSFGKRLLSVGRRLISRAA